MNKLSPAALLTVGVTLLTVCATFGVAPSHAATTPRAEARYRQDRADCLAGRTGEDRKTCLKEAAAALQAARAHQLTDESPARLAANERKRCDGLSGDDFEFWDIVNNKPVAEDSTAWAFGRVSTGLLELAANGYRVFAWETPHYESSALSSQVFGKVFPMTYQRAVYFTADKPNFYAPTGKDFAVGQIYPYAVDGDYYGQRILPEDLGNIEYDIHTIDPTSNYNYTPQDIITNAKYALAVRDGFASFFFHPYWLEPDLKLPAFKDFQSLVTGITNLGYTWVDGTTAK